jgi:hypothetical protein
MINSSIDNLQSGWRRGIKLDFISGNDAFIIRDIPPSNSKKGAPLSPSQKIKFVFKYIVEKY